MTGPTVMTWGVGGKVYSDPSEFPAQTVLGPALKIALLNTDGNAFTGGPPRRIIGDKSGTATVVDQQGNSVANFPITGLEQNVAIQAISALVTTTKVWGLY